MRDYKRGLVPISGDPITNGHLNLTERALVVCSEVIVFVANNDTKKHLFNQKERALIVKKAVLDKGLKRVRIISGKSLLTDIYLRENCDALFRGIRESKDKDYEDKQMFFHKRILPSLDGRIIYLEAEDNMKYVSSSVVKSLVSHYLSVSDMTPLFVQRLLEERILGQYKVAITGGIAVGKSFVSKQLALELFDQHKIPAFCINIDQLVRDFYKEKSPAGDNLRKTLAKNFGNNVLSNNGNDVNREILKQQIFHKGNKGLRIELHKMTAPHIERKYREALNGKKGIVILEWAQLAEMNMGHWTNNNCIVVDSQNKTGFANKRNLNAMFVKCVAKHQWSAEKKVSALREGIAFDNCGEVIEYQNIYGNDERIKNLAESVMSLFQKPVF